MGAVIFFRRFLNGLAALAVTAFVLTPISRADLIDDEPPPPPADGEDSEAPKTPKPGTITPAPPPRDETVPATDAGDKPGAAAPDSTGAAEEERPTARPQTGVLAPKGSRDPSKRKSKKRDGDEPVHFESNGAKAFQQKGTLELVDDVVVTQGTMRVEADYAKVFYDEALKDVSKVIATGNVKMFKIDEDSGEKIQALGDQVTFLNKERRVTMEGNARLWRGADLVRGKKITYEMDTGWIRADRVVGEVHPGNRPAATPAASGKADQKK